MNRCRKSLKLIILLYLILCLAACGKTKSKETFQEYTNELFRHEAASNSIACNYLLSNPKDYDVAIEKATLGNLNKADFYTDMAYYENMLSRLHLFNTKTLSASDSLTYDIAEDSLKMTLRGSPYFYYTEPLGPSTGLQAQLPILLSEFNYNDCDSIQEYLDVLNAIPDYFDEIITFEKAKAENKLFMSKTTAESIISQCRDFIKEPDHNLLISIFNDRTNSMDSINDSVRKELQRANIVSVKTKVIPSYEKLIKALEELKDKGTNDAGLCNYPKGKDYYQYVIQGTTGSDRSIDEIRTLLQTYQTRSLAAISSILTKDASIGKKVALADKPVENPKDTLDLLSKQIANDFPTIPKVKVTVKEVHPSLADYVSPAFYLSPTIDHYTENLIYINNGKTGVNNATPSTLAHEGYPGHLFQAVFFNASNPNPLRQVLSYGGYSEGWATYAEIYSMRYQNQSARTIKVQQENTIVSLCIYALCDIGIHYDGWNLDASVQFLKKLGIDNEKAAHSIYDMLIAEPGNYLKYTLGYIEFAELKKKAQKEWGNSYSDLAFHTFVLKTGPASFTVLNERIGSYKVQ